MTTLTIGTTIRRLNHLGYPAFEKMNQNGMMIKTTTIRQMISPYIGIISDMARTTAGYMHARSLVCGGGPCRSSPPGR